MEGVEEVNRLKFIDDVNAIYNQVPQTEILAQLAEEATELAHAALKLRRVLDGTNPTETELPEAETNLQEEYADVELCWTLVDEQYAHNERAENLMEFKAKRWIDRLHWKEMHDGGRD